MRAPLAMCAEAEEVSYRHQRDTSRIGPSENAVNLSGTNVDIAVVKLYLRNMQFDRITQDPNILAGRAAIRGLRISVAHVVNLVANGMTPTEIVAELPDLEEEDVRQALAYAAALARDESYPLRA